MSAIPNPSPNEIQNLLVLGGFTGFMVFLVILLLVLVWYGGQELAKMMD